MDAIIQQLSRIIQNNQKASENQAEIRALREILLSGLSRSGFLKEFPFLPEFETISGHRCFLCFLDQDKHDLSAIEKNYLALVETELKAFGADVQIKMSDHGFSVMYGDWELTAVIIHEDLRSAPVFLYQQTPIPYELRYIMDINEGLRRKIELVIESEIKELRSAESKVSTKSSEKKRRKKKENDSVQQLSLFDF